MFVRKKRNKSGSISIQIVEKVRRKNKVIKTIGCSSNSEEVERLYKQALNELPRLYGPTLFDKEEEPKLSELSNDNIRVCGADEIFGRIYDKIGYKKIKEPLLKDLVISRLTHPGSKLELSKYLTETGKAEISVYSIYRFLDKLNKRYKKEIEEISFNYTKQLLGNKIGVVFYDITTIYFESSKPDELRIAGFSKDGKHQNPQILLGLLVGRNAYPIGYEIFEGNKFEGHTLVPVLEEFSERFKLEKPIVVADAGLLTNDNINLLIEKGYKFIIGARIKNESKAIKGKIKTLKLKDGETAKFQKGDNLKLIISYSAKRASKDKVNRERGLKRLEKQIKSGKLTKANINNRGYNKYLKMTGNIQITIDKQKFEEDALWDGLKGYTTNTSLSAKKVIENYNNLWQIEKAFRISKTDLQIRPIYHRLKERIESHICISFVSYLLYKELERLLELNNFNISVNKAIEQIKKIYEIVIENNFGNKQTIKLKKNYIQQRIYDIVNPNA